MTAIFSTTWPDGSWSWTGDRGIPWKGNYSSWLDQKQTRLQQEEKTESERQKTLKRELEWIHMSPKGRHAKGKARINSYEELLNRDVEKASKELEIYIPPGPRLGNIVIEANDVAKGYGDNILMEGMTFSLPPGGIIGVIGPNGAGKTTLFRMITGQEKPDSGAFRIGETVKLAYVDQNRDVLDPNKTIWEVISGGDDTIQLGKRQVNFTRLRGPFQFLRSGPAKESLHDLRRRKEPRPYGPYAQGRGKRSPPRRADKRSRCQHYARPRRSAGKFRRLRRRHQPRPMVPRPNCYPYTRLRRRQQGSLV